MDVATKESLKWLKPYKPAKTIYSIVQQYGIPEERILKLAGNESRFGASKNVARALWEYEKAFSFYPDFEVTELRRELADFLNIEAARIVCGSGSFELISILAAAYINHGDESIYADPTFGMCIGATVLNGGKPVGIPVTSEHKVDLDGFYNAITENTKIIWICNPNNPTGTLIPQEELEEFLSKVPENILVVLDEAYIDFVDEPYLDTVKLTSERTNLVVLRTFSKAYGLASLRIGYGISSAQVIDAMYRAKLPINTSLTGQVGAIAALKDQEHVKAVTAAVKAERGYYYHEFDRLKLSYVESQANFILVCTGVDASYMEESFLKYGIMVRNGAEFGERYKNFIRITIGTHEDNIRVITALEEILKNQSEGDYPNGK